MQISLNKQDLALLTALQADGRLSNHELAERVGLSASQCSRRRTRLEDEGVITGYRALVDGRFIGRSIIVMVNVGLSTHSHGNARHFKRFIQSLPQVAEAYSLAGEADYQLRVEVSSLEALAEFLSEKLLAHESVQQIRSNIVLETIK